MKKLLSIFLALMMLLSLAACGASSPVSALSRSSDQSTAEAPAGSNALYSDEAAEGGYGGFAMNAAASESQSAAADGSKSEDSLPEVDPDKIIYSADATVETTDFDGTLAGVAKLVEQYNGWIESSSINGANYYSKTRGSTSSRSASYTIRIPSASFSDIMGSLSTLGNVPYTYTYTDNVTSQYYDAEARLTAYRTQEARLLEMMEKAETVEDVITIEEKLTELRYQIESLQSTLKNWDRQVSYSTVYLSVEEVAEYTPETPAAKPGYGQRLLTSLRASLRAIGGFFSELLIWLAGALPVLLVLAAAVGVVVLIVRSVRRKRRAGKVKKSDAGADDTKEE